MAEDFIEEAQREAKLRFGKELTPDEMATQLARHGLDARVHHLKTIKSSDELSLAEASRRLIYERALKNTHDMLRKVDR